MSKSGMNDELNSRGGVDTPSFIVMSDVCWVYNFQGRNNEKDERNPEIVLNSLRIHKIVNQVALTLVPYN